MDDDRIIRWKISRSAMFLTVVSRPTVSHSVATSALLQAPHCNIIGHTGTLVVNNGRLKTPGVLVLVRQKTRHSVN